MGVKLAERYKLTQAVINLIERPPKITKNGLTIFYLKDIKCVNAFPRESGYSLYKKVFSLKRPKILCKNTGSETPYINNRITSEIFDIPIYKYIYYLSCIYPHSSALDGLYYFNDRPFYKLCLGGYTDSINVALSHGDMNTAICQLYSTLSEYNPGSVLTSVNLAYEFSNKRKKCITCGRYNPYINFIEFKKYTLSSVINFTNINKNLLSRLINLTKRIVICDCQECGNKVSSIRNLCSAILNSRSSETADVKTLDLINFIERIRQNGKLAKSN